MTAPEPRVQVHPTTLDGVVVLTPPTVFEDFRGRYVELYNDALYRAAGVDVAFVQDDYSMSSRGVLRGIHGDDRTWKLITCLLGELYMVVLNYDRDAAQFGRWESFVLSEHAPRQVLVPPKFGIGHLVLSERAIFHYKQSTYYDRASQFTVLWNDPRFGITWPIGEPILSQRDRAAGAHT